MEKHYMDSTAPPSYDEVNAGIAQGFKHPDQPMPMSMPMPQQNQYQPTQNQQIPPQMPPYPPSHHSSYLQRQQQQQQQVHYPGTQLQMPLQQHSTGQPVAVTTLIVNQSQNYGPHSQYLTCPFCAKYVKSKVIAENNISTHIFAGVLFLMGCCLCSCIPYCVDSCKNKNHYCPNCEAYLGSYSSMNRER